jgi:hypothetical protein
MKEKETTHIGLLWQEKKVFPKKIALRVEIF